VRAVVDPGPARPDELAGLDHRGVAQHSDQVALTPGLDPRNVEAVLFVVEGNAVDEPG